MSRITDDILSLYQSYIENNKPIEKYPGVTKVLGSTSDSSWIDAWRARVGEEEADRILAESQGIGTSLDNMVNKYLLKESMPVEGEYFKEGKRLFNQLEPILRKRFEPILVQAKVWSDNLRVMGYLDSLGYLDGELTLVDFKNSKYAKSQEHIQDYWNQTTAYTMCLYDMLGVKVRRVALMIALRNEPLPQILLKETKDHIPEVLNRTRQYYEEKGKA